MLLVQYLAVGQRVVCNVLARRVDFRLMALNTLFSIGKITHYFTINISSLHKVINTAILISFSLLGIVYILVVLLVAAVSHFYDVLRRVEGLGCCRKFAKDRGEAILPK